MTSLSLPLRLARREVLRRPGRTALVALLVALPVAGMAMAVTLIRTDAETPLEEWERSYGQADAVGYDLDVERAGLPEGSRTVSIQSGWARVKTADGTRRAVEMSDLPLEDPLTAGIQELVAGRAAEDPDEVVLSARLADDFGVEVGDEVAWDRPALTRTLVGEVEPVGCLSCATAVFAPGAVPAAALDGQVDPDSAFLLIDLPDGLTQQQLVALYGPNDGNVRVRELQSEWNADVVRADRDEGVRWSLVLGAVVLTVVGIVISAAFAVGARRQLVTLGQLSASGAAPAAVRMALVLQGTVTGALGALSGLVLAAVALSAAESFVERLLDERLDGYDVRPVELGAAALIGVAAATVAALIPARTAARVPTLAALAGRRPLAPVSRRLVAWGFACMLGGLSLLFIAVLGSQSGSSGDLWALVAIVGGVAELLGACAIAPAVAARLEPLANRFRGSLRLGARSLARHRARTGAVISAVAAAGALAVAAGGLILGTEASQGVDASMPDDVVVVTESRFDRQAGEAVYDVSASTSAAVAAVLPEAREIKLRGSAPPSTSAAPDPGQWEVRSATETDELGSSVPLDIGWWDRAIVVDGPFLDAIRADDDLRDALDEAGVVALSPEGDRSVTGPISVLLPDGREVPGIAVPHRYTPGYISGILLTEATAGDLGLEVQPLATLFESPEPLTGAMRADIEDLQYDLQDEADVLDPTDAYLSIGLQWAYPDSAPSPFQLELILSGVALVFSLFVVGVSLALAAAESRDERDILTIAGAPPGMLARAAGARAWLLAVLGAAMAVPVGFLPVVVFARAQSRDQSGGVYDDSFPLVFPTRTVLLLVLAVPLAVALVSWLGSTTAQRLRPLRVSTATFE